MGRRDMDFLLALESGDSEKYHQQWDKLTQYADSFALSYFSSPVLREDVVQQAMDEVEDWVGTAGHLRVDLPWEYARVIIRHSISRSSGNRELEGLKFAVQPTVLEDIKWTDEGISKLFIKTPDGEAEDEQGSGYRFYQSKVVGKPHKGRDSYINIPRHKFHEWIKALHEITVCHWRWNGRDWVRKSINKEYEIIQGVIIGGWFDPYAWAYAPIFWSIYNVTTGHIQDIRNPSEKRIMKALFSGFKQVKLAKDLGVSEAYISRVKNNYLKEWGWNDLDIDKAQIILYTHSLAAFYRDFIKDLKTGKYLNKEQEESILFSYPDKDARNFRPYLRHREYYVQPQHREELYNRVVNSDTTRAYFSDLEKTQECICELMSFCNKCFSAWYPRKRIRHLFYSLADTEGRKSPFFEQNISTW